LQLGQALGKIDDRLPLRLGGEPTGPVPLPGGGGWGPALGASGSRAGGIPAGVARSDALALLEPVI
jgi:hypothetical protein